MHLGNSLIGCLLGFIMDKTITLAVAFRVSNNLAGKNAAKVTEGVIKGLVVDGLVEIFDEHIALARLAEAGVSVRPHYPARSALDGSIVQGIQGTLSINVAGEVDISIAKRMPGERIAANADGGNSAHSLKNLEQERFRNSGI